MVHLAFEEGWETKDFSSTKVRTLLEAGESLEGITHPDVAKYIQTHFKDEKWA